MMNICNKDCFHCSYPECINDKLSLAEYKEDITAEEVPREVKMNRIRANRYVTNHREECKQRSINYYYSNYKDRNKKSCEYAKENKDRVATAKRERYHRNIEESRQKQRDYRARKKEELIK